MEEKIKQIMSRLLDLSEDMIDDNTSIDNVETWDSLKHLNLMVTFEENFDIEFNEDEIELMTDFMTIKKIIIENINNKKVE